MKCRHNDMQTGRGCCSLCFGSIEYCECGFEVQLHEGRCPNDPDFAKFNPNLVAIKYWKDLPYQYRQPGGCAEQAFGLRMDSLNGGFIAVYNDGDITEQGRAWLDVPPAVPGISEERAEVLDLILVGIL